MIIITIKEIYGISYYESIISKLSNKEIAELVENLSSGVPIATPVFDGASTKDINEMSYTDYVSKPSLFLLESLMDLYAVNKRLLTKLSKTFILKKK